MSIRWFIGECAYNISEIHDIRHQEVMMSIWKNIDLVNMCEKIKMEFPSSHSGHEKVADCFKKNHVCNSIIV